MTFELFFAVMLFAMKLYLDGCGSGAKTGVNDTDGMLDRSKLSSKMLMIGLDCSERSRRSSKLSA